MERDLLEDYRHHAPPTARVGLNHDGIRGACLKLAYEIRRRVPEGREQSLALTKLEEAMFWSNAGIARNGFEGPEAEQVD